VLSFIALGLLIPFAVHGLHGFFIYSGIYFLAVGSFSFKSAYQLNWKLLPGVIFAIIVIHISFGMGFIIHLIGRPFRLNLRWFETLSR
jgi:hypothetical protein